MEGKSALNYRYAGWWYYLHKVIIQVDLYQAEMAKVLTKGVEMWFFYKIIRFLETYALFLHTEP